MFTSKRIIRKKIHPLSGSVATESLQNVFLSAGRSSSFKQMYILPKNMVHYCLYIGGFFHIGLLMTLFPKILFLTLPMTFQVAVHRFLGKSGIVFLYYVTLPLSFHIYYTSYFSARLVFLPVLSSTTWIAPSNLWTITQLSL